MKIAFHGGKCCGIKTIHGMGYHPNSVMHNRLKKKPLRNTDAHGGTVRSDYNFFNEYAPGTDTYLERLDRYLEFLDRVRPYGIVEITLASSYYDHCNQNIQWGPLLRKRGFRKVTDCHNSNSGNRVFVYHRKKDK